MHPLAAHEVEDGGPLPCVFLGEQIHDSLARDGFPVHLRAARLLFFPSRRRRGSAAARLGSPAPPSGSIQIETGKRPGISSTSPRHLADDAPTSYRPLPQHPVSSAPASRLLCHLVVLVKPTVSPTSLLTPTVPLAKVLSFLTLSFHRLFL